MEKSPNHGSSARSVDGACCRCSKSDLKMPKQCAPFLENAVTKIQERRSDLANRQKYLKEKITAMERSIPAIMAFNMWKSGQKQDGPPFRKIQQIMNKISPHSDPTEKLVDNLKKTVNSLNLETAELHDKIIEADIKLEESQMALESLELENKEFDDILEKLEKEVNEKKTPSLHSIHSEDIFCIAKIRQLGEEEINLKNSIRELEERETIFQEQINKILTSREFLKSMSSSQSCGRKLHSCPRASTSNVQETKKKFVHKPKEIPTSEERNFEKQSTSIPEDPKCPGPCSHRDVQLSKSLTKRVPLTRENGESEKSSWPCMQSSCPGALKASTSGGPQRTCKASPTRNVIDSQKVSHLSKFSPAGTTKSSISSRGCPACCKNGFSPVKSPNKTSNRSANLQGMPCCQLPISPKQAPGQTCKKCQGWIPSHQTGVPSSQSAFLCKGKCANLHAKESCNCSAHLKNLDDEEGHPRSSGESSTDEEYCECCDCGCNDTDFSSDPSLC